jgi:hypothetical protein
MVHSTGLAPTVIDYCDIFQSKTRQLIKENVNLQRLNFLQLITQRGSAYKSKLGPMLKNFFFVIHDWPNKLEYLPWPPFQPTLTYASNCSTLG